MFGLKPFSIRLNLILVCFVPYLSVDYLVAPSSVQAQGMPPGGMPPGGGQRRPRRPRAMKPPEPISVEDFDKAVARQHKEADTDRDGYITVSEVRDGVARLADEAIRNRFEGIDDDRSGTITYDEFSSWQSSLGSQALSDKTAGGARVEIVPSSLPFDPGKGPEARLFARMIRPLDPVIVSQADQNYDGKVSVEELQKLQRKPFTMADANSDGFIDFIELQKAQEAMRERRAAAGGRPEGMPPGMFPPDAPPANTPDGEATGEVEPPAS